MRSVWNGTLSFGLVSIPIKLYSATESKGTGFKLLCKKCMTPVHYQRICEGCEDPVEWSDTMKALDLGNGQYLPFTDEELEKIKPEKSDRIEIMEFISQKELEPLYYNKFYFCAPQKAKERSYFLFKEVLKNSKKVAVGRFVMREKEYVCAIQVHKSGLLLSTLNYKYEIRDIDELKELQQPPDLKKEELDLAEKLVDQLYEKKFNLEQFKDTFAEQLQEMIDKKEKIEISEKEEETPFTHKSLMDALKASLS